jgi:hypothetical protein
MATVDDYNVTMKCEVRSGDSALSGRELQGRVFLKMDVEGYELEALAGLQDTLGRVDHAIIEVSPEWLSTEGVERLFGLMTGRGLRAFELLPSGELGKAVSPAEVRSQSNVAFTR